MARVLTAGKSQKFRPHRSRRCWKRIELDGIMMIHDVYSCITIFPIKFAISWGVDSIFKHTQVDAGLGSRS